MGLGIAEDNDVASAGITDPLLTMDNVIEKYEDFITSSSGDRIDKTEGLRRMLNQQGYQANPRTLNIVVNYLDGLERGE
ncbi:MAG: hypothetical protein CM15mV42_0680 [uncultured marine virus]|nr:MAG: hypothetical protein CM15mV42_0680 [uncultured marine virus]